MLGKQGWKFLAGMSVLALTSMGGIGCQSLALIPFPGKTAADTQAPAAKSPITLGRPEKTSSSPDPQISTATTWWNTPREETKPQSPSANSGWSPAHRAKEQPNTAVATSGLRPGETITQAKKQDFFPSGPILSEPPVAETPLLPAPRKLTPQTSQGAVIAEAGMGHGVARPAPSELSKVPLPPYIIETPDILIVEAAKGGKPDAPVKGQHLVRPDGTIGLGIYGAVRVSGLTVEQARKAVAAAISPPPPADQIKPEDVNVDVLAYNSKVYYVITDGGGYGEQVYRFPYTGNETVLDAFSLINGLPAVASKKHVWIARRVPEHGGQYSNILPVEWESITRGGTTGTNYQIFPGDRIYVQAQKIIRIDTGISKVLAPIERILGVTLLGSETVNSIRNRGSNTSGLP
jgi:polysaccharide biosynthesis/export protein